MTTVRQDTQTIGRRAAEELIHLVEQPKTALADPGLYEAAEIDGANGWQQFRYLTLALLKPNLILSKYIVAGVALGGVKG